MSAKHPRVLIVTYYWPPAGGSGVQRWLKFTRYLREFGVEPIIYTPEDPDFPVIDESLLTQVPKDLEIVRLPIWEPYHFYRKIIGKKREEKIYSGFITDSKTESFGQKLSVFVRGNFFIPDARKFWIKPSIRFLKKYLKENNIDLIISTGPPHSMHLIALGLKQATGIPWIADFRDPWTNIDFYHQMRLRKRADKKYRSLELEVLKNASRVVSVSDSWARDLELLGKRKVEVITNGFDEADFPSDIEIGKEISLTHIGSISIERNATLLWEAIEEVLTNNDTLAERFKLQLIGPVDQRVIASIVRWPKLSQCFEHIPWQDHSTAIQSMMRAKALLLLVNDSPKSKGRIPGKLFEYLRGFRPILSIGPATGDVIEIIRNSRAGLCAPFDDKVAMVRSIMSILDFDGNSEPNKAFIGHFSRNILARQYSELIKSTCIEEIESASTHVN